MSPSGCLQYIIIVVSVGMIEYMMVRVVGRYRARIILLLFQAAVHVVRFPAFGITPPHVTYSRIDCQLQVEQHVEVSRESMTCLYVEFCLLFRLKVLRQNLPDSRVVLL